MLAEFFLTPDAFCESGESLQELERCLFPFNPRNPSIAIICRLGDSKWTKALGQKIARMKNHNHRVSAMKLMQRVESELAVIRPLELPVANDESSWLNHANQSRKELALDGIVVSSEISKSPDDCTKLADFLLPDFWNEFGNPRHVEREKTSQVQVLRAFCAFTDWIVVRMPQVRGGNDDEIVTVKQIIELATRLPKGFRKSEIEVQYPLSDRMKDNPDRAFRSVKSELQEVNGSDIEIRLTLMPTGGILNREILGGEHARTSSGNKLRKARWLMTMSHVAVGGRQASASSDGSNSWNLFSRRDANDRLVKLSNLKSIRTELI